MPKPIIPGPPTMPDMKNMLAYTIQGSIANSFTPMIVVGQGASKVTFSPKQSQNDSYWFAILDRTDPKKLVKDFVVPGQNNTTVPAGLEAYMSNPQYLYALVTQALSTLHVPQGALYDFLKKYGAGREMQRLEQVYTSLNCGTFGHVSYILTGQGDPRNNPNFPPPPTYEIGSIDDIPVLTMSLMPLASGPPYSICDSSMF
ncbi:MAG TPA: hypothetical protein VE842_00590 [Pyrinomonadaceae bacterium]|nr:hypothetical protein [Pyrinomonadaceae bacterium]